MAKSPRLANPRPCATAIAKRGPDAASVDDDAPLKPSSRPCAGTHNHWRRLYRKASTPPPNERTRRMGPGARPGRRVDMPPHSRDTLRPSFAKFVRPQKERGRRRPSREGAGKTGCALHPRSRVQRQQTKIAHEHTGSAEAVRPSLRNGFTAYFVLSPVRPELVCHRRPQRRSSLLGNLTPAIGASGPHDFAVRLTRRSSKAHPRPPLPAPTSVTMANAPSLGTGWQGISR